mgnify:CR=1 FL=1
MRIRAAVLEEFGKPLVIDEVDLVEPKAGEVLVRLEACGVCHTDAYTASGVDPTGYAPCVLGHEGAGVVEKVGPGVTMVRPGDHVVTLFAPECGECIHCRSPRTNRCISIRDEQNRGYLPDGTTRLFRGGEPLRHFMGCSTFAEYTVMPEIALAVVSPEAPLDGCAPFACGLSTGIGAALFGLGIPPAQYDVLAGDERMANVLRQRLEKLACHFPVNDNYFAWQAFSRGYGSRPDRSLPPYLQEQNFAAIRDRAAQIDVRHVNLTDHLACQPEASLDRYILLDAQDWMDDGQLTRLWTEITRTARPGSRVLFRTAAEPTLLPGRIPDELLARWDYREEQSLELTREDRSSIYGGVHLYVLR